MSASHPVPILTGPTGVGKTRLSLELGGPAPVEIISADSRQVYTELTIGTAKPDAEMQARVPHHFIDERSVFDSDDTFSAGTFATEAWKRIRDIRERGHLPLVVGGSTLYVHALHEGLADIPDVPSAVRAKIESALEEDGPDALFERLQQVDPDTAAGMDATKTRRVQRALEVYEATGHPLSYYHQQTPSPPFDFDVVVLHRERQKLYDRINARVDTMLAAGLVDEVAALDARGVDRSRSPLRTIGYKEVFAYLDGDIPHNEMVRLIKRNTRRYAKRQLTWFRRYDSYTWVPAEASVSDLQPHLSALSDFGLG
ncbi:MAG: tRNA (adenosine(37)-N6)-dimethylallyltransferase MiaA [Bacteroidetes bacterium]|nr:tRNA (adenosine(37)-N6)-dimethylallyltransferase MiaA [Bacteroidota bacterium]